jgi:hypothetical protein
VHFRRLTTFATTLGLTVGLGAFGLAGPQSAGAATPAIAPSIAPSGASAARPSSAARLGAAYIARQIDANGGHLVSFGVPDISDTAYAVLGLHAAGIGANESRYALTFLRTQVQHLQGSDGRDDPALLGYVIMAAVTSRKDPTVFGGTAPVNNLVARLRATVRTSGRDAGLFGSADPSFDGAFRQGVALAALAAAHVSATHLASSISWLTKQQCADGLWTAYRSNLAAPCPAADPNTFAGPDTNSTAMAIQGLAAYGDRPGRAAALASLHNLQTPDGGYPFLAAPGQPSDPDSTALVIQGLLAEKVDPGRAVAALAKFQFWCTAPVASRGAYFFPGSSTPNIFATVQAVPAAARKPFPLAGSTPSIDVPVMKCPPPATPDPTGPSPSAELTAVPFATTLAGTAGPCPAKTGVTVSVDFTAFKAGVLTRCAPGAQASGIAALQHAGFTVAGTQRYGLAFVCRIDNRPAPAQQPCITTPPPTAFWAYYHALAGATTWTYSTLGATSYKPPLGSIDAWAFGKQAKPTKTPAQVRAGT